MGNVLETLIANKNKNAYIEGLLAKVVTIPSVANESYDLTSTEAESLVIDVLVGTTGSTYVNIPDSMCTRGRMYFVRNSDTAAVGSPVVNIKAKSAGTGTAVQIQKNSAAWIFFSTTSNAFKRMAVIEDSDGINILPKYSVLYAAYVETATIGTNRPILSASDQTIAGGIALIPNMAGVTETFVMEGLAQTLEKKALVGNTAIDIPAVEADCVNAVASSLTTNLTGTNNDLVYTAKTKGTAGDDITIAYLGGTDKTFGITVTGTDIVVQLATTGETITTIADDISAEITSGVSAGGIAANALVTCVDKADNDGSEVVTAMAETPLAGGVNGTIGGRGVMCYNPTSHKLFLAESTNTVSGDNWYYVLMTKV